MGAGLGSYPAEWELLGGISVRSTGWAQGDLAGSGARVDARRKAVVDLPWTSLRQVHGARVVVVDAPAASSGEEADCAVCAVPAAAVAVTTADCAPVVLASPEGVFAVVHVGWRGLRAGAVEGGVQAMRRLGATTVEAVIGPCIHACCYTFSEEDLADVARRIGPSVRATDRHGRPAMDLPAGVRAALHTSGARFVDQSPLCTCCSEGLWSYRADRTERRQATVAWRA
jgi:YfiH family protein